MVIPSSGIALAQTPGLSLVNEDEDFIERKGDGRFIARPLFSREIEVLLLRRPGRPAFCDPFNGRMLFQLRDTIISKSTIFRNEDLVCGQAPSPLSLTIFESCWSDGNRQE